MEIMNKMNLRAVTTNVSICTILVLSQLYGESVNHDFWSLKEIDEKGAKYSIQFENLIGALKFAPQTSERISSKIILSMPSFLGEKSNFKFYESSVMHPNLAKRYQNISSFIGIGIENPTHRATLVINEDIIIGSIESDNGTSHFKSFSVNSEDNELLVYFMSMNNTKFRKLVKPGDVINLDVKVIQNRRNIWKFKGEAFVRGDLVSETEFTAMMVPAEQGKTQ